MAKRIKQQLQAEVVMPVVQGGTGISTYVKGDILYANGINSLVRLPAGADGQTLTFQDGIPAWSSSSSLPTGGNTGDILYWNGSAWTRLPIAITDYFLKVTSGVPVWFNLFGTENTWTAKQIFTGRIDVSWITTAVAQSAIESFITGTNTFVILSASFCMLPVFPFRTRTSRQL